MLPEVIQLEKLRQEIEDAEYAAGSDSDYLDRGKPNPAQAQAARQNIAAAMQKSAEMKSQLHDLIAATRQSNPGAIEEWVELHRSILKPILLEESKDVSSKARINVANQTHSQWEKILQGEQDYVSINWYFLKDYRQKVRDLTKKNVKGGWKFWK
jgi:hypothetical protein